MNPFRYRFQVVKISKLPGGGIGDSLVPLSGPALDPQGALCDPKTLSPSVAILGNNLAQVWLKFSQWLLRRREPLVKVPKENYKKRMSIHTQLQDTSTYTKAIPFRRQWKAFTCWTVCVSWVSCAFGAEDWYGVEGDVWNGYEPAIRSVTCTTNIIYFKSIYKQFHKLLYSKELTISVGCGIVGNSRRSSDLLMTPVNRFWKDTRIHGKIQEFISFFIRLATQRVNVNKFWTDYISTWHYY